MRSLTRKFPLSVKNNNVRCLNNELTRPNSTICVAHICSIYLILVSSHNNRIENYFKKTHFLYQTEIALRKVISQCNWLHSIPTPQFFDDPFSASPSLNPAFVCLQQFFPCLFYWLHFFPFIILVHPLKRQAAHCKPPSLSTSLQFYCLLEPLGPSHTPP